MLPAASVSYSHWCFNENPDPNTDPAPDPAMDPATDPDANPALDPAPLFTFFTFLLSLYIFLKSVNFTKGVVEKAAETQTSIGLASHLIRAPKSRSGGREFESPVRRELGALTKKVERPLRSGLPTG
jgi:hypothetical protein